MNKYIYWTPRVISILFLLFLAMFSLDVFGTGLGFWETVGAFLMHNIIVIALAIVLAIAWKREIVGAIAFFIAGALYVLLMVLNAFRGPFEWYMLSYSLIVAGPAFLIGALFLAGWNQRRTAR